MSSMKFSRENHFECHEMYGFKTFTKKGRKNELRCIACDMMLEICLEFLVKKYDLI